MHGMTSGSPLDTDSETRLVQWFVMRDLTRSNAKLPAYLLLAGEGIECFSGYVRENGNGWKPLSSTTCCLSIPPARCWILSWSGYGRSSTAISASLGGSP